MRSAISCLAAIALIVANSHSSVRAQATVAQAARAVLIESDRVALSGDVDSNSPVVWDRVAGRWTMFVITSFSGQPSLSAGRSLTMLQQPNLVAFADQQVAGVWMESVIRDIDGTWYGYYHQERSVEGCERSKVVPRLGAAVSHNRGRTWVDLGPILELPESTIACSSNNHYFLGGAGDFTAILDRDSQFLYFYYTQYAERAASGVGVAVARMTWAERDEPQGKLTVWNGGAWLPASFEENWEYPVSTPFIVARDRWDNGNQTVDVFWGPAVHWNRFLNQYVMFLNRADSNDWDQEGVYVSYNPTLDDPRAWGTPAQVFSGGRWYPQVIGLDGLAGGTDKEAGEVARFYMSGVSDYLVRFIK
jgi:hypothetical protein